MAGKTQHVLEIVTRVKGQLDKRLGAMGTNVEKFGKKADSSFKRAGLGIGKLLSPAIGVVAVGAALALATKKAVEFGSALAKSMVDAASQAEEVRNKFDVVFGEFGGGSRDFAADLADRLDRSQVRIESSMARLQDTFVPLGISREKSAELSKAIVELGVDLTSFNDTVPTTQESLDRLTSAIVGNHEATRRLGIVFTEADLKAEALRAGISSTNRELTSMEKIQARLNIIIRGSKDAIGDAERTADEYKNTMIRLEESIFQVKAEAGEEIKIAILQVIEAAGGPRRIAEDFRVIAEGVASATTAIAEFANEERIDRVRGALRVLASVADVIRGEQGAADRRMREAGIDRARARLEEMREEEAALAAEAEAAAAGFQSAAEAAAAGYRFAADAVRDMHTELERVQFLGVGTPPDVEAFNLRGEQQDAYLAEMEKVSKGVTATYDEQRRKLEEVVDARAMAIIQLENERAILPEHERDLLAINERYREQANAAIDAAEAKKRLADAGFAPFAGSFEQEEAQMSRGLKLSQNEEREALRAANEQRQARLELLRIDGRLTDEQAGKLAMLSDRLEREGLEGLGDNAEDEFKKAGMSADIASSAVSNFASAASAAAQGSEDAFSRMATGIAADLVFLVAKFQATQFAASLFPSLAPALGVASAKGNVFSPSGVVPFADGGIVTGPTLFPYAGGKTGLMGEAGPEAIMPLRRGSDGKLGVDAGGGDRQVNLSLSINAIDTQTGADVILSNPDAIGDALLGQLYERADVRAALEGRSV
jgi:lambda family phage tail tape measure protein